VSECDEQILGAYHDGELTVADRARVEQHLATCARCSASLARLHEASQLFASYPFKDITSDELNRLHAAIDEEGREEAGEEAVLFRIGGTLGLIAASILVVGFAWLRTLPSSPAPGQATVSTPVAVNPTNEPAWERVAVTLRPDPASPDQDQSQMAEADFMADQLQRQVQQQGSSQ
jgi:anti-sigma factor RsiW